MSCACRVAAAHRISRTTSSAPHLTHRVQRTASHARRCMRTGGYVWVSLSPFDPAGEVQPPKGSVPHPVVVGVDAVEHPLLPRDLLAPRADGLCLLPQELRVVRLELLPGIAGVHLLPFEVVRRPCIVNLPLATEGDAIFDPLLGVEPGEHLLRGGEPGEAELFTLLGEREHGGLAPGEGLPVDSGDVIEGHL